MGLQLMIQSLYARQSAPHRYDTTGIPDIGKERVEMAESKAEEKPAKNSRKRLSEAGQRAGPCGRARQESISGRWQ